MRAKRIWACLPPGSPGCYRYEDLLGLGLERSGAAVVAARTTPLTDTSDEPVGVRRPVIAPWKNFPLMIGMWTTCLRLGCAATIVMSGGGGSFSGGGGD